MVVSIQIFLQPKVLLWPATVYIEFYSEGHGSIQGGLIWLDRV